jgi:hypothetical protein
LPKREIRAIIGQHGLIHARNPSTANDLHKSERACVTSICGCTGNEWSAVAEGFHHIHTDSSFRRECLPIYREDQGHLQSRGFLTVPSFVPSPLNSAVILHLCDFQRKEMQVSIDRDSKLRFRIRFLSILLGHHSLCRRSHPNRYDFPEDVQLFL